MKLPQCSHITRKRGIYYFRRRLPSPGVGEITMSLRTRSFRHAEHLAAHLDEASDELFSEGMYDSAKVTAALKAERSRMMEEGRRKVIAGAYGLAHGHERAERDHRTALEAEGVKRSIALYQDTLRTRDLRGPEPVIRRLLAEHGLPEEAFAEFGLGWVQASLDSLQQRREWMEHGLFDFTASQAVTPSPEVVKAPAESEPASPLLSSVVPQFIEFSTDSWRGQTLHQNTATFRMFLEVCGNRPVSEYKQKDISAFVDVLKGLPALYSKSAEWRNLSLVQIAEQSKGTETKRLEVKTIRRHVSALGGLFGYMKQRGLVEGDNPAHDIRLPKVTKRASDAREMWEGAELTKLFQSPVWTGCKSAARRSAPGTVIIKDARYWLPLLGLYHGNRLEEFAQLDLDDVHKRDGIWCLSINDEEDKQVKNAQSVREVPLHPEIERLGFLDYVESIKRAGQTRVFPELRPGGPDKKLGFYVTKWWSQYRKDVGVYRSGLDYHSFRHGVTTKLYAADVSDAVVDALVGHEGGTTSRKVYLKRLPIAQLHAAICLVSWPEVVIQDQPGVTKDDAG